MSTNIAYIESNTRIQRNWVKIKKGDHVMVKYYGIRSPRLGLFLNVVRTA